MNCVLGFLNLNLTAYDLLHNVVLQITTIMPRYTMT